MKLRPKDLLNWTGTVDRLTYALIGVVGFAIKHILDQLVALLIFNRSWHFQNYLFPGRHLNWRSMTAGDAAFYLTLLALALPFIWMGVMLTVKRLRSARLPIWLAAVFFLPFLNLPFFLLLCLLPEREAEIASAEPDEAEAAEKNGSATKTIIGTLATAGLACFIVWLGVSFFKDYGWSVFVAAPFCQGFACRLIAEQGEPRSLRSAFGLVVVSTLILAVGLLAFAIEGFVCILMAAPIWLPVAFLGAFAAGPIQARFEPSPRRLFSWLIFILPVMMGFEHAAPVAPPTRVVRTAVEIDAPPEMIWKSVVSFQEIPPPREWMFRAGVAYPVRAELEGSGVGAIRHCVFSTGAFIEPIQVWDEPRLLRFSVTSQPPAMSEWSPYANLAPAHLDGYFRTSMGQFLLTPLPGNRTRLEGSTWYSLRIHPNLYWSIWSDRIVHRIHRRVLEHIKQRADGTSGAG